MKPVRFPARDGLSLSGYLTLPLGQGPWPMVLLVHGGPWTRDYWGFDAEAQFMANRGLAVLQVNFRGSTGFGKKFWTAGFKQWGRAMQDDLSDAVAWAVTQGLADPKRVGIFGASYGGYAALAGLAFTPELYACGVDYAGPSNLFTQLARMPAYWGLEQAADRAMIGDPVRDKKLLRRASPFFHLERIRVPLLVAQGGNDPRVKRQESDQVVRALRDRGLSVQYMLKENEGHGFGQEENDLEFYRAVEGFLARHLGSRRE
jgi:dipeptidyl aminopeptidase/acylaminoacyl peptidase